MRLLAWQPLVDIMEFGQLLYLLLQVSQSEIVSEGYLSRLSVLLSPPCCRRLEAQSSYELVLKREMWSPMSSYHCVQRRPLIDFGVEWLSFAFAS